MKWLTVLTAIIIILTFSSIFAQEKPTGREIFDRSIDATRLAGVEATSTMTIIDSKGRERVRKIAQVTKLYDNGDTEKKLVRFLAPADVKGTGLLTYDYLKKDDDMWLYMPALRKTRRIISSEKAKNFMGSEFSYADMTPPNADDFDFKVLGEKNVNGTDCWQLEIIPKNDDIADENGFSKRISFIGKDDYVIRKAIYYDLDGSLYKELNVPIRYSLPADSSDSARHSDKASQPEPGRSSWPVVLRVMPPILPAAVSRVRVPRRPGACRDRYAPVARDYSWLSF